jgi:hypothetical protein
MEPERVTSVYNGRMWTTRIDTVARMRLQILNQSGQVLDELILPTAVTASIFNPITMSLGGRFRAVAERLADQTTSYLRDRTGIH